jgi:hypothetical protein
LQIAVDSSGNTYIGGWTTSTDFPLLGTSISPAPATGDIIFVTKADATGTTLVYSTYIGGTSGADFGGSIAVDANGFVYISGATGSTDFPVTSSSAYQTTLGSGANRNAFLTKLSADGQSLLYSTYLGGSSDDTAMSIAVDTTENAYLSGATNSADFPTTINAVQSTLNSSNGNAFVARIDTTQSGVSSLTYSTFLGGASTSKLNEVGTAIKIGSQLDIYVTGMTCSSDFPTTLSAYKTVGPIDGCTAFLSQIDPSISGLSGLIYSTYFGGTPSGGTGDQAWGLALDAIDDVYISGGSSTSDFPTTTGATNSAPGKSYVAKFDTTLSNSSSLIFSTLIGGTTGLEVDVAGSVAVDTSGNVYLAGYTTATDFPITGDANQSASGTPSTSYLTVLNQDATVILYSTYWGGTDSSSWMLYLVLDSSNNIYVLGQTESSDLETTAGALQSPLGGNDAFVSKFEALP